MVGDPDISGLNGKSRLFSIAARKSALYLAVHRKVPPSARKSAFSMAVTGTKHAEQPFGADRAASFEEPVGVFASRAPLYLDKDTRHASEL